jgi:hypothetical protein
MPRPLTRVWRTLKILILLVIIVLVIRQEGPPPGATGTLIDQLIAGQTFNYLGWELDALYSKGAQMSLPTQDYASEAARKAMVLHYFQLVGQADEQSQQIEQIYGDPSITDPVAASAGYRAEYSRLQAEMSQIQPAVEGIIAEQVSTILAEQGFAIGGQVIPPVEFHFTPLPQELVISPRDKIERLYDFSLEAGFTVDRANTLENEIDQRFNVSSLVVPIGGMGLYPTMLLETDSLEWVLGTVAHEWTHNWLTMFPVGWSYGSSAALTTMNETAANIVENEVGPLALARFYPERVPPPAPATPPPSSTPLPESEPVFNFQKEMHATRVQVDLLLSEGKVTEAEAYMDARRQVFWDNGYHIRKLNQAYFAFYGSYADQAGAAGADPVGPAVVQLRKQSPSLKAFLLRLAPMTTFGALQRALK